MFQLSRLQIAVEPAVRCALHARRRGLHVILRVEVRARGVRRSARVHDRQRVLIPKRLERRETRIEPEETVEIDSRIVA